MRTLNIEELETIGGGADDSNSAAKGKIVDGVVAWALGEMGEKTQEYVEAYDRGGMTSVIVETPAFQAIIGTTSMIGEALNAGTDYYGGSTDYS